MLSKICGIALSFLVQFNGDVHSSSCIVGHITTKLTGANEAPVCVRLARTGRHRNLHPVERLVRCFHYRQPLSCFSAQYLVISFQANCHKEL